MGGAGQAISGAASAVGNGAKAIGGDVGQIFKQSYIDPIHQGLYGDPATQPPSGAPPTTPGAAPAPPTAPAPGPAQTPLHTQIMQSLFGPQAQQSGPTAAQRNRQLQGNN